jgi:hypothetical protein
MSTLAPGRMSWADALAGPLAGATCLWQDLDGLHVESAPASPPPTSLLWGWHGDTHLVRVRLDGDIAFVAVHTVAAGGPADGVAGVLPWAPGDHRIAAHHGRGPSADAGGLGAAYEQIVVDGIADGVGPITFVRPSRSASDAAQHAVGHAGP